jgi:hypothetical protein
MVIRKTTKKKNIKTIINGGGSSRVKAVKQLKKNKSIANKNVFSYESAFKKKKKGFIKRVGYGAYGLAGSIIATPVALLTSVQKARRKDLYLKKTREDLQKKQMQSNTNKTQLKAIESKLANINFELKKSKTQKVRNAFSSEVKKGYSQGLLRYALSTPGKLIRGTVGSVLQEIPGIKRIAPSNSFLKTVTSVPALGRATKRVITNIGRQTVQRFKTLGSNISYLGRATKKFNPFSHKITKTGIFLKGDKLAESIKYSQKEYDKLKSNTENESKNIEIYKLRLSELSMKTIRTSRENDEISQLKRNIKFSDQKITNYKDLMKSLQNDFKNNLLPSITFLEKTYKTDIDNSFKSIKNNFVTTKDYLRNIVPAKVGIDVKQFEIFKKLFENETSFDEKTFNMANAKDILETAKKLSDTEKDPTKKAYFNNLYDKLFRLNYRAKKLENMDLYRKQIDLLYKDYNNVSGIKNNIDLNVEKLSNPNPFIGYSTKDIKTKEQLKKEIEEEKLVRNQIKLQRKTLIEKWKSSGNVASNRINRLSTFLSNVGFMKWININKKQLITPKDTETLFRDYLKLEIERREKKNEQNPNEQSNLQQQVREEITPSSLSQPTSSQLTSSPTISSPISPPSKLSESKSPSQPKSSPTTSSQSTPPPSKSSQQKSSQPKSSPTTSSPSQPTSLQPTSPPPLPPKNPNPNLNQESDYMALNEIKNLYAVPQKLSKK